jgi:hypothetical protein
MDGLGIPKTVPAVMALSFDAERLGGLDAGFVRSAAMEAIGGFPASGRETTVRPPPGTSSGPARRPDTVDYRRSPHSVHPPPAGPDESGIDARGVIRFIRVIGAGVLDKAGATLLKEVESDVKRPKKEGGSKAPA